ncbi:MAG: sugar O-acyltransferase, sialic acid O-acetyltransferase NeuD family [Schlesneria sp.]|nr:sugar O-acyltransferase, sialic acid O-acetyltransferase NeuD family [Schlesneria sp.]
MLNRFYRHSGKRLFDVLLAGIALMVLSPILLFTAIMVRLKLGTPVLFRQQRPGWKGKPFLINKFRTMRDLYEADGTPMPDEFRLTSFGQFLRAASLDELPELWNILVGEMSLVGPRPLKMSYLELYTVEQARRHDARPGLTGWAQVNGRNSVSWQKRFELDTWYVDNISLWLDLKIVCMTVGTIFGRKGISAEGHSTMPDFDGQTASVHSDSPVVVIGAGGHSKVVISALQEAGTAIEAVYDDDPAKWGQKLLGIEVRGPIDALKTSPNRRGIIGIGDNGIREKLSQELSLKWVTIVHPFSYVHPTAQIGEGSVVMAGAVIQPDVVVGRHCIVNTSSSIDHDCRVGDFSSLGPGTNLSGGVRIGNRCMLGTGCAVLPGVCIEDKVTVGAGTTVIRDQPAGCTIVGAASRMIRMDNGNLGTERAA